MLNANDTQDLILNELGASAYRQIEPPFTADRVRRVLGDGRGVSVLAALLDVEDDADELRDVLSAHAEEVTVTPVDEGMLIVAYRPTQPQSPPPVRARRRPARTTTDAQPVPGSTEALVVTAATQGAGSS